MRGVLGDDEHVSASSADSLCLVMYSRPRRLLTSLIVTATSGSTKLLIKPQAKLHHCTFAAACHHPMVSIMHAMIDSSVLVYASDM